LRSWKTGATSSAVFALDEGVVLWRQAEQAHFPSCLIAPQVSGCEDYVNYVPIPGFAHTLPRKGPASGTWKGTAACTSRSSCIPVADAGRRSPPLFCTPASDLPTKVTGWLFEMIAAHISGITKSPQQTTLPSGRRPQTWIHPTEIWVKAPVGGAGTTYPQQVALPSSRRPQVSTRPADIWVKAPAGAVICPAELSPQQVALPSARSPQVCQ